jgi:non-specific serine/threonine protein kinase
MTEGDTHLRPRTLYLYRFGTAEFDESRFELRVGTIPIELQRKPMELLAVLLAHGGEVVTKEELLEAVWPGMTTVENVIANAMTKLRQGLGEQNAAMILTVPKIGYRFNGPLERVAVGRKLASALELKPGMPAPERPHFMLATLIGRSQGSEVWTARHAKSQETRVYKYGPDGARLTGLKREATLSRVLRSSLGARDDIARILDWNFETPPFFLECEYGGQNLIEWAEEGERLRAMALPDRLGLFLQIADAVAAAHGVGVLHKDIKPGNVLVAARGEGWQVRLTDFGSGRLLDPEELERLGITPLGVTMNQALGDDSTSGTLLYLAPELIAGGPATLRSDIYALGLILFQMIVGDLRRPLMSSWERDIDDPLLRADVAATTDGDAARRLDSAAELARRLRALEARRHEAEASAAAEARATATADALARSRARRPWVVATIAGLGLGVLVSSALFVQVRRSARNLAAQVQTAQTLTRFLTDDLVAAADPAITGRADVTMAEAVRSAAGKIETTFAAELPELRATLHIQMQRAFRGLTQYALAVEQGDLAVAALRSATQPDAAMLADALLNTADSLIDLDRLSKARDRLAAAAAVLKNPPVANSADAPLLQARFLREQGFLAAETMDIPGYLRFMAAAWDMGKSAPGLSPRLADQMQFALADAYRMSGQSAQAEAMFAELIRRETQEYGADDARPAYVAVALAMVLGNEDRTAEAVPLVTRALPILERALGPHNGKTINAKQALGDMYYRQKKWDEAANQLAGVASAYAATLSKSNTSVLSVSVTIAQARLHAGEFAAAERVLRDTLAAGRATVAPTMPLMQTLRFYLALCLLDQQRPAEVPALLAGLTPDALGMAELEPDWPARLAYAAGRLALAQGDAPRARTLLTQALAGAPADGSDGFLDPKAIRPLLH